MSQAIGEPYAAVLRDLIGALGDVGLEPILIGGIAVSLISVARYTADVDAMVFFDTAMLDGLMSAILSHGFRERFTGMAQGARLGRLIAVEHEVTGFCVDLALGCMPFEEEVVARATAHRVGDLTLRLPTPEDLVILKAIAHRPKDLEDIRTIASVYPRMDRERIAHWVVAYGELLDEPELWGQIEPLLECDV